MRHANGNFVNDIRARRAAAQEFVDRENKSVYWRVRNLVFGSLPRSRLWDSD